MTLDKHITVNNVLSTSNYFFTQISLNITCTAEGKTINQPLLIEMEYKKLYHLLYGDIQQRALLVREHILAGEKSQALTCLAEIERLCKGLDPEYRR